MSDKSDYDLVLEKYSRLLACVQAYAQFWDIWSLPCAQWLSRQPHFIYLWENGVGFTFGKVSLLSKLTPKATVIVSFGQF